MFGPHPRFRLYTDSGSYRQVAGYLTRGRTGTPHAVTRLEHQLSRFLEVEHVACTPQNRVGVYLALKHLIRPNSEIIMSPYTIADITNMVILAGGKPVFADVDRATCNISAESAANCFSDETGAVLVTHLHGLTGPIDELSELCAERNIPLIEDAAQSFGARWHGRRAGTLGHAGVFSFGMYKNVNGWMGGAVASDDGNLISAVRNDLAAYPYQRRDILLRKVRKGLMSDIATFPPLFRLFTFWVFRYGFLHDIEKINRLVRTELDASRKHSMPSEYLSAMSPAQAGLVQRQLDHVDAHSEARIERALRYHCGLKDVPDLLLPPARTDSSHIYTYFPIQYADRDALLRFAMQNGRDIAAQHYRNNASLPGFEEFHRHCPNAAAVADQLIFLPTYPRYPLAEVDRTIDVIRRFFDSS